MSKGCGTMASPSGQQLCKGKKMAASSNGKQHTLPAETYHKRIKEEHVKNHWALGQPKNPTRMWGSTKNSEFGGLYHVNETPYNWTSGEFWNVDSNIRIWGEHETRRNSARDSHDVHRHDQIARVVLPPKRGAMTNTGKPLQPRQCISGVIGADSCFLEAFGFDLGLRDRQANNTTLWKPVNSSEMFRSQRSFSRDKERMTASYRSMRKSNSSPGSTFIDGTINLQPEDVGGEAGELQHEDDIDIVRHGRTHGSRSCHWWDRYDHTCKREACKMSNGTFSPFNNVHNQSYPMKEHLEVNPASVYTLKYRKHGERYLRDHVQPSDKETFAWSTYEKRPTSEKTMRPKLTN